MSHIRTSVAQLSLSHTHLLRAREGKILHSRNQLGASCEEWLPPSARGLAQLCDINSIRGYSEKGEMTSDQIMADQGYEKRWEKLGRGLHKLNILLQDYVKTMLQTHLDSIPRFVNSH